MKILILNTSDISGGAARATYRLHKALINEGIDSKMLVQYKESNDFTVIGPSNKFEKFINLLRPTLDQLPLRFYRNRKQLLFSPSYIPSKRIIKKVKEINPDIVHLHWVTGGFLKIEDFLKIKKPILWTLHDNWAFTGGCHIMWGCMKYKDVCGSCHILNSRMSYDLSTWVWKRKQKTFSIMENLYIVCPSRWMLNCSKGSYLLRDKPHFYIPNPIDTSIFKPFDKFKSREILNLPFDKKIILCGAFYADENKGFYLLNEAINNLKLNNIEICLFGVINDKNHYIFKYPTRYLGTFKDDFSLVLLYNAADLVVVPSKQENLSNTIMESLSCGTPVVAFDIGGNSDMIEHKLNGYLAKPFNTIDLAQGIEWILSLDESKYRDMQKNARQKVLREFDAKVVAKKYVKLYEEILNSKKG